LVFIRKSRSPKQRPGYFSIKRKLDTRILIRPDKCGTPLWVFRAYKLTKLQSFYSKFPSHFQESVILGDLFNEAERQV
jgi:hypothetical protein